MRNSKSRETKTQTKAKTCSSVSMRKSRRRDSYINAEKRNDVRKRSTMRRASPGQAAATSTNQLFLKTTCSRNVVYSQVLCRPEQHAAVKLARLGPPACRSFHGRRPLCSDQSWQHESFGARIGIVRNGRLQLGIPTIYLGEMAPFRTCRGFLPMSLVLPLCIAYAATRSVPWHRESEDAQAHRTK